MKTDPSVTSEIILETRKTNKSNQHPVKLRVTWKRTRKYYTLSGINKKSLWLTPDEWDNVLHQTKPRKAIKELRAHLVTLEKQASDVIKDLPEFTFAAFEGEYFTARDKNDLFSQMAASAKQLRKDGRISTAVTFECALNSLKEFTGKERLPMTSVTVKFLKNYQAWMTTPRKEITGEGKKKKEKVIPGNSLTTVGIYLRNVRTVFNEAKITGLVYPFGKPKDGLYRIPKGRNVKKALTQQQVAQIAAYKAIGYFEERSRDLWLFSYLCNGINFKDIARLKYENIHKDAEGYPKITIERAKTAEASDENATIHIIITRQIGRIIDRWGTKTGYIFPILQDGMTPEEEYKAVQQIVHVTNDNMKRICEDIGIDPVTTYTARHSFATILKRSGASVEFISESLGHRSKQTTLNYLANFEDEEKRKWAEMLLPENDE